jgi:hypothetical protein
MDTTDTTTNPSQNGGQNPTSSTADKAQQAAKAVLDGIRQIAAASATSHK